MAKSVKDWTASNKQLILSAFVRKSSLMLSVPDDIMTLCSEFCADHATPYGLTVMVVGQAALLVNALGRAMSTHTLAVDGFSMTINNLPCLIQFELATLDQETLLKPATDPLTLTVDGFVFAYQYNESNGALGLEELCECKNDISRKFLGLNPCLPCVCPMDAARENYVCTCEAELEKACNQLGDPWSRVPFMLTALRWDDNCSSTLKAEGQTVADEWGCPFLEFSKADLDPERVLEDKGPEVYFQDLCTRMMTLR